MFRAFVKIDNALTNVGTPPFVALCIQNFYGTLHNNAEENAPNKSTQTST